MQAVDCRTTNRLSHDNFCKQSCRGSRLEVVCKICKDSAACQVLASDYVSQPEEHKLEMVDTMLANNKLTDEEIAIISGIPLDEIQKRRAQR